MSPGERPPVVASPPTAVSGGAAGLAARYAELRALASAYDLAGGRLREQSGLGARVLADGDLLESAVLSPLSFAEAEAAVLWTTAGPGGLLVASLGWETDALLVRATVQALEATDALVRLAFEAVDYAAGRALGAGLSTALWTGLSTGLPTVMLAAAATAPLWLPPVAVSLTAGGGAPGEQAGELAEDLAEDLEEWLTAHPGVVRHLANGGGGLVDGFWSGLTPAVPPEPWGVAPFTPTTENAAGILAGLYPPERAPEVTAREDLTTTTSTRAPNSLAGLIGHLDEVNAWSTSGQPENAGTIEIQSWRSPDGVPRHVVYLPGADDLMTLPWTSDGDVRDLPSSLLAVSGQSTAYAEGVLEALRRAGVAPTDPVLLAGHSQGGIVAAWLAAHADGFHVAQVVTAGSPVSAMGDYPPDTRVLSLEHHGDVVPLLDGEDNPDAVNHVTVTFDAGAAVGLHSLSHYVHGAAGVDASTHPSLVDALDALRADGFLGGAPTEVHHQAFQITRRP